MLLDVYLVNPFLRWHIFKCILFVNFSGIDNDAIFNNFSKLIVDKLFIIVYSEHSVLVFYTLIYCLINLESAFFKVVNQIIVELSAFDNKSVAAFAYFLIKNLFLFFIMIRL